MYGGNTHPVRGKVIPWGENFFTVGIFRKNSSKYANLMIESCICDDLSQIYKIFKWKKLKFILPKNRLEDKRLIFFVRVWLYFDVVKIDWTFLKLSFYNLCMVEMHRKRGVDCHTIFFKSFTLQFHYVEESFVMATSY